VQCLKLRTSECGHCTYFESGFNKLLVLCASNHTSNCILGTLIFHALHRKELTGVALKSAVMAIVYLKRSHPLPGMCCESRSCGGFGVHETILFK
jgi:hypothetical protein